jgi:nitrite reductase (NADH) large subunit
MTRTWKCEVCGYVHQGDSPPEVCPVCGVGPEMFSEFEVQRQAPAPPAARWRCVVCDHVHEGDSPPEVCPVCGAGAELFEPEPVAGPPAPVVEESPSVVILGAGIAGVTAAEHARRVAPKATITLLSKEAGRPYYRLNLTRFLAGEVEESGLDLQPPGWFDEQGVELVEGEATFIHREEAQVELRDGRRLPYDRLVLATGAHAFVPPIPGVTRRGVLPLRTLQDARRILARVRQGQQLVVLGGGLLGLEVAGALSRRGAAVTVLEGFGWLLPRQLARPAGELLQGHLEEIGIDVRCDVKLEEILGDEDVAELRLADGVELPAEMVVLAVGVRPNSYLARQSGLDVGKGVLVDDRMQTSDPRILAAGDVTEHRGVVYGLWPSAYAQGAVAGVNAAGGGSVEFPGLPVSNRLKVLDVDLFSIGDFEPRDGSYRVVEQQADGIYRRLVCRDGQLVGANLYGDTSLSGVIKTAVEEGTQLSELPASLLDRFPSLRPDPAET